MLLLDFELEDEALVQGFVREQWPGAEASSDRTAKWSRLFQRSASLWSQFGVRSAAVRLEAKPGAPLTSLHAFVAPRAQEARLRLALAALLRTHGFADATAATPCAPADLDDGYVHLSDARVALGYEPLTANGGARVHYNLRLFDYLDRIIMAASDLGVAFAYEAQVTPWSPPRDLLRRALYDVAELERQAAIPGELLGDQRALAERLKRATFHVEECLACTTQEQAAEIAEILENILSDTVYRRFGAPPRAESLSEARAEAFGRHVHSWLTTSDDGADASAAGATKDDVDERISLRTLLRSGDRQGLPELGGPGPLFMALTGAAVSREPAPHGTAASASDAPFLFISYARADSDDVNSLVENLSQRRVSTWIDHSIPGGEDWPTKIEERLLNCSGVLALVSPSFVESHYCSREVIFADALRKPILPVFIHPADLKRGLAWLLSTYNQIYAKDVALIITAIQKNAPQTIVQATDERVVSCGTLSTTEATTATADPGKPPGGPREM